MADGDSPMGFFPGELLEQRAHEHPDRTALIAREEVVTFSLLNQRAHGLAAHLQREGIRAGDRVGVLLPNSAAIPLTYFATQRVGAVPVMLDVRLKGQELRSVLHDAKLALLVTRGSLATDVEAALEGSRLVPMWLVDGEGEGSFERRLAAAGTPLAAARCEAEDDAVILYTSGTTGDPKGVVLSYGNLAQYPRVMTEYGITGASTVRGCILPMSHIVGPLVCNDLVDKGFTLVIFDQINPVTLLEGIQKHRVSVFESVPIVFLLLLGVRNLASYDTSSLTVAAMMGTSIPVPLLRAFQSALPHVKVIQGYGLTETSPMVTLVELDRAVAKMGSIGRAVPGIEVRIVNEAGEDVPRGEPGEIITRGPHVMKGYFGKPAATADCIRAGWFFTGDVGRCDEDGYYYHLGRRDDMIIIGGLNVYPAEVENAIYTYPGVQETVVFAVPDAKRGHVLGAAVVPRAGHAVVPDELLAFLRGNLAAFRVPRRIVIRDSLPRTSSGKVIRDAAVVLDAPASPDAP